MPTGIYTTDKRRGRPPLSPSIKEQREQNKIKKNIKFGFRLLLKHIDEKGPPRRRGRSRSKRRKSILEEKTEKMLKRWNEVNLRRKMRLDL